MAGMLDCINLSNNSRPLYTSYELSKMVKDKRLACGVDEVTFSNQYEVPQNILSRIEEGTCSFSPVMYKACAKILDISTDDLLKVITDDMSSINYRTDDDSDEVEMTFDKANWLFNEIIMQDKISAR